LRSGEPIVVRRGLGVIALAVVAAGVVAAVVPVGVGRRILLVHLSVEVDLVLERDLTHQEVHDPHLVELLDRLLVLVLDTGIAHAGESLRREADTTIKVGGGLVPEQSTEDSGGAACTG
jgi:hypothetical protein